MQQVFEWGRLAAVVVLATALAMLGYSVGYQSGHAAGLERMDWHLNMLTRRQLEAVQEAQAGDCGDGFRTESDSQGPAAAHLAAAD